jgi:hypothetical protein
LKLVVLAPCHPARIPKVRDGTETEAERTCIVRLSQISERVLARITRIVKEQTPLSGRKVLRQLFILRKKGPNVKANPKPRDPGICGLSTGLPHPLYPPPGLSRLALAAVQVEAAPQRNRPAGPEAGAGLLCPLFAWRLGRLGFCPSTNPFPLVPCLPPRTVARAVFPAWRLRRSLRNLQAVLARREKEQPP